ncbi:MAG: sulfatase-like hydrolase/transferase [Cyanobacteria bacterium]|nr:sulfatase-like hydrolase/transferase [Cyanobacteriota bacterium]
MIARHRLAAALAVAAIVVVVVLLWRRDQRSLMPGLVRSSDQNVLLVTIDTLRGDALGSYGGRAATPHLDALAARGLRFTFAHAHAVMTLPSHSSILTGRYPFEHGVRDNAGYRLDDTAETLAEIAKEQGFATGAFVGAFPLDRQFGLAQGFDVYHDVGGRMEAQGDFAFTERRAEDVVRDARAWIDTQTGKWFAWVHVFDPHAGYAPPPPFDAQYRQDPYAGEVAYVDQSLGPLLSSLEASARPTLVVVTADHGEGLGDHGEATHGTFAYESTLRVPLIVAQAGPGARAAGRVVDTPARHIDLVPTIAEAARLPLPDGLSGRSLFSTAGDRAATTYFEAMTPMLKRGWAPLNGVISGRDKYINVPIRELYDLAADPGEQRNLEATSTAKLSALQADLGALRPLLPGEQRAESANVRARLESLGYVSGSAARKARYTAEDDPKQLIDVDRLMMDGIDLFRQGRLAEAMDAYRAVLARRPTMGLAYRRLAFLQWQAGDRGTAIATLKDGRGKLGADLDLDVRLGTYLAEAGSPSEAVRLLERVTAADPGNTEALNALGIAYARGGAGDKAIAAFTRVLSLDPRDVYALENIGAVHLQRGDLNAARDAFTRAAASDPRSSRAHAGLGIVARRTGRIDQAVRSLREAVTLDAANFDALYNLCIVLIDSGRGDEARPFVAQFIRTAPRVYSGEIAAFRRWLQ